MRKKLVGLLLTLMMLCSACLAEGLDYASMTNEQLHAVIDAARNELAKRELLLAENTVLCDQDGVQVYLSGEYELYGDENVYIELGVVVINDSDKSISVNVNECSINGWTVFTIGAGETPAGKKKNGTITIQISGANISTYEEIEDIELSLLLYDMGEWETVSETNVMTLYPNR